MRRPLCDDEGCAAVPPSHLLSTLVSCVPFIATFAVTSLLAARKLFPYLSHAATSSASASSRISDGEDHFLPSSAPPSLQQAHAAYGARSSRRQVSSLAFASTVGLAAVLAELILAEILEVVDPGARETALGIVVPSLLGLVVGVGPFLEIQSIVTGLGWSFQRNGKGRLPRVAWMVQILGFVGWLCVFWSVGHLVPQQPGGGHDNTGVHARRAARGGQDFDSTAAAIATREGDIPASWGLSSMTSMTEDGATGLARASLERVGVMGIFFMAWLSGFASVSSPWHTFADGRRKRPVTEAEIARKQAGLDATNELLLTKRHRLRSLQRKAAEAGGGGAGAQRHSVGLMGKLVGSIRSMGGGDGAEIKGLQMEISGLESMETNLAASLSLLRTRRAADARGRTAWGKLLAVPTYLFSVYCIYRVLATLLTTIRRAMHGPAESFSTSDPITRSLALFAKHWDPKLDQLAWARQISFCLSGVILLASINSAVQTFHLFAKWLPGLLHQAQANLPLLTGQVAATYVISAALLLRSNLPREVGSAVGDALLQNTLEPVFVDRWFEGWFLFASGATAVGIWVGRKISGGGGYRDGGGGGWDEWDDYGGEEMAKGVQKMM